MALGIFLRWSLRYLNYTKFNKAITRIFVTIASRVTKKTKIVAITNQKEYNCHHYQGELITTIFFLVLFFKEK